MDKLVCCSNCFSDKWLDRYIITGGDANQTCSFCLKKNIICISPEKLTHLFLPFTEFYEEALPKNGTPLWELLKRDWLLFNSLTSKKCEKLLKSILPEIDLSNKFFLAREFAYDKIDRWANFKEELKHINRYFCSNLPEKEPLEAMFSFLSQELSPPASFFRARISDNSDPIPIEEMGKPPQNKVGNGRANPIGISYLYTASDYETSIAEIRPHVGDSVSVCEFEITKNMVFVDLRNPRETLSPFDVIEREEKLETVYGDIEYLNKLGDELSKPVIPREANLEYLSSQYLCELIKHLKYDGVIYKSSVSSGANFALFDDKNVSGKDLKTYKITKNNYQSELIEI